MKRGTLTCLYRMQQMELNKDKHDNLMIRTSFYITSPLLGEYTGHQWIAFRKKPVMSSFYVPSLLV